MISIDEIDKAILELEAKDTTYAVVERLAWLYTVRDHLKPNDNRVTDVVEGDEFCEVCSCVPYQSLMQILAEHMSCIRLLYPKEYDSIIAKIKGI